eukprot:CAMPEP_0195283994 /NCGR_PEP_ID=MMETSP0707-20130614/2361_1 /TAXON_ID=33640 /ORGANISM="Asterionellopsis glacialis, Strain CCMP134" /LENGTH=530 /DNA_ID=CAMNT_0040343273 /DNA_START=9 /DNA_END=1598 /DNA_ORIENTATION=-
MNTMQVFGVGYGCTGSQSLQLALKELGYSTYDTTNSFFFYNQPFNYNDWYEKTTDRGGDFQMEDSTSLLKFLNSNSYNASTDTAIGLGYERLMNEYPNAKFILTIHESDEEWFHCWSNLITSVSLLSQYAPWLPRVNFLDRHLRSLLKISHRHDDNNAKKVSSTISVPVKSKAIEMYHKYNRDVHRTIPSERLMEVQVGLTHTWEPLCGFLSLPVPLSGYPIYSYNSDQVLLLVRIVTVIANLFVLFVLYIMAALIRNHLNYKPAPITQQEEYADNSNDRSQNLRKEDTTIEDSRNDDNEQHDGREDCDWVPRVRIIEDNTASEFCYLLNKDQMQKILAEEVVPVTIALRPWKRLYRLERDGDSFETFLHLVDRASQTLLVIRTDRGELFGAYADSPWNISTTESRLQHHHAASSTSFYGSAQSCLFSFRNCSGKKKCEDQPHQNIDDSDTMDKNETDEICVYKWTGANRYFQLCDTFNKRIGLGGGQNGVFGLAMEDNFSTGSTGRCDTYGNEALSDLAVFNILDVEVW